MNRALPPTGTLGKRDHGEGKNLIGSMGFASLEKVLPLRFFAKGSE